MSYDTKESYCASGLSPQPNFQKEGLDRTSTFREGMLRKKGMIFFRGRGWELKFLHKKK